MPANGENSFIVTRDELVEVCKETQAMIDELRQLVNVHADVLGCHRYILQKFVPAPLLEAGAKEYRELRDGEIEGQSAIPPDAN